MAIGAHQLVAACHVLLTACNSAMGELSHDPLALLHDWTIEPPNLIEDNTWKSTPAPEAKPSSSYATQILKEPDTELEARRKGLGVSSMIMNHDAPSLPLPSGETHFGRAFDYQELTGRNIGVHTNCIDHFPTYNHPSASVLAPTTPLTEDHPNVYSSKTQMNGLVDSTSLDRKWKPVSQSVGPSAHDSGSLPETAAHAIKHRKIFKFPFALAPSNPPLGSKKPKLDQPPINFELRPRIKNEPGVIDHDSTSSHPNLRFSGKFSQVIPSLGSAEAGEMIEKIVFTEIRQNIPIVLPFNKLEFNKNIFEGSGLPFSDDHVKKLERMNRCLENFPGEILFIPPREEYKYVGYMNEYVHQGNTGGWSNEKNLRRRRFWMNSAVEVSRLGHLWLEFWEKRSGIDLMIDFRRDKMDVLRDMRQLYVLFLFFVDMINTTTETNRDPKMEKNLFQLAKTHFEEFRHICIGNKKLKVKMREFDNAAKLTNKRLQNPKLREVLWYYLSYWMEKGGRVSPTIRNLGVLKSFFNDVFAYSIRNFNKKLLEYSKPISEA
ncbi:hypothetical protein PGTUg99_021079 [Puccinia graminis f. sp. tritici]|uniref:Uncharacterized protein n=1 Tax=Puccinia graminis f. sp. tritici TaxID=56615 RepID=A0A5B0N0F1_PUCGR|nr:hypothetical protein PGTUg99_021079 [Puccinia graminis f. sp. tritici]